MKPLHDWYSGELRRRVAVLCGCAECNALLSPPEAIASGTDVRHGVPAAAVEASYESLCDRAQENCHPEEKNSLLVSPPWAAPRGSGKSLTHGR